MRWHVAHLEAVPAQATEQRQAARVHRAKLREIEVSHARIVSNNLFKLLDLLHGQTALQANAADRVLLRDRDPNGQEPAPLSLLPPCESRASLRLGPNHLAGLGFRAPSLAAVCKERKDVTVAGSETGVESASGGDGLIWSAT